MLVQVAIPGPFPYGLTYQAIPGCELGRRVWVPLRQRQVVGIITSVSVHSAVAFTKLKAVSSVFDEPPLFDASLRELFDFVRDYYHVPLGEAYYTAMPQLLCRGEPLVGKREKKGIGLPAAAQFVASPIQLNPQQEQVIASMSELTEFGVQLLEGVTGSGKTEVYLKRVEQVLEKGHSALVLVPEIGLTPQTLQRFQARFGAHVAAYHSGLTETVKRQVWRQALQGEIKLVIGTRSAVFLPLQNLSLMVIDEEHDTSYKQNVGVPYSAKNIAIKRAIQLQCPVILGSATPSVEALYFAGQGRYAHFVLPARARGVAPPTIKLIDMRQQPKTAGLSRPLIEAMKQHLQKGQQVLIFLNRRGYAPIVLCHECGTHLSCPDCEMSYTLHQRPQALICHHCSRMTPLPKSCPNCAHPELIPIGQGTEQLEEKLQSEFAAYKVVRLDQDSTRLKGSLEAALEAIHRREAQIIIGTQMLAKGHDFAGITLVGIVDLDYGFFAPDFRGMERMGQLLIQVAGRAGRFLDSSEVLIQTHVPEHPLLRLLLKEGYGPFAAALLQEREEASWPPFRYMALFRAEHREEAALLAFLQKVKTQLGGQAAVRVLGPVASGLRKKAHFYRAQLLLESSRRASLHQVLTELEKYLGAQKGLPRYLIDVDPLEV